MLRSLNSIERYTVTATDGDVGTVSSFLLDDHAHATDSSGGAAGAATRDAWAVRYLIVQTGGLFHRRRVLVSPISVYEVDAIGKRFRLALNVEKIRNSPSFDADRPVLREHEREHSQYYQYPYYWDYSGLWGMGTVPGVLAPIDTQELEDDRPTEPGADAFSKAAASEESQLRNAHDLVGYSVRTPEGTAGDVEDFLVDDDTYEVRHIVVNTGNAGAGHAVVLDPSFVTRIDAKERQLYVSASTQSIVDGARFERQRSERADADGEAALEKALHGETRGANEAVGAAGGAIAGGILGSIAGPPGVAAGAVLGGIAGAITEAALETGAADDATRVRELDDQLGITGGDIGAKNLQHPPAKRAAYNGASVGADGSVGSVAAEGPIPAGR